MNDVPFTKDDDDPAKEQKQAIDMPRESTPMQEFPTTRPELRNGQTKCLQSQARQRKPTTHTCNL